MHSPRRVVVTSALRGLAAVVALVALYYLLPLRRTPHGFDIVWMLLCLAGFAWLAVRQVRSITRAAYPGLRAFEVLALLVPLFVLFFAATYYAMQGQAPSSFSTPLSRTDALYFTVTVLTTVGFGDITPRSETARVLVMFQMLGGLVVVGVLVRLVVGVVQHTRANRTPGSVGS
jgi:voltage-gated potassium channel